MNTFNVVINYAKNQFVKFSSKARKKKGPPDTPELDSSLQAESTNDLDSLVPKSDEFPEPDQKNGIGAAGITAAEGGPSMPTSGGDGDTSTQEGTGATDDTTDAEAAPAAEVTTPVKSKKPKKPKLKSSSSNKKRPSK